MLKKDLIKRSPVEQTFGADQVTNGAFGAVLSRAGVGKTSFLVQIALTQLLVDRQILHISLDDNMEKINLRYQEAYTNLVDSIGYVDPQKAHRLWEDIQASKVGISYTETTFDTNKIRDYLKSFKTADLILPSIVIIDGLDFDQDNSVILDELAGLSRDFSIFIWFSMKSHRDEKLCSDGYPVQLEQHKDRFDKAIFLNPVKDKIEAIVLKDGDKTDHKLQLNPATMMVIND